MCVHEHCTPWTRVTTVFMSPDYPFQHQGQLWKSLVLDHTDILPPVFHKEATHVSTALQYAVCPKSPSPGQTRDFSKANDSGDIHCQVRISQAEDCDSHFL
jgi:hypothetical protein